MLLFCVAACGKEPEPAAEPSTESIPVSSNTLISTEPQKPYWDTHEPLSYAGIYNGQRFSGDYEIASYDKTKEGDAYFKLPRLEGKVEDVAQQFLVRKETITDPFLDIYYDKKNNRYVDAWQTGYRMDKDGYPEFDFKTTTYYYSNTSCTIPCLLYTSYQYAEGCEIDQVIAQWHANLLGLGSVFQPAHLHQALEEIYRQNFKQMRSFNNPCRCV